MKCILIKGYIEDIKKVNMFYRSIDNGELYLLFKKGYIYPRDFKTNTDSTIKRGKWSFWFDSFIRLRYASAVVVGNFYPKDSGVMSFSIDDSYNTFYYKIKEFVTDKKIKPYKVYVSKEILKELENSPISIIIDIEDSIKDTGLIKKPYPWEGREYEEETKFKEWIKKQKVIDLRRIKTIQESKKAELVDYEENKEI